MAGEAAIFRDMLRIRLFEQTVLRLFEQNKLFGTTHTCIGQEACAVAVVGALDKSRDVVFSNHRCHGHFLTYGGSMTRLFAELMGRQDGVCGGRGGSQHLCWRNFYTNGIQGGIAPLAVGAALAEKRAGTKAIVCVFMGDGTLGQGVVYESFNIASKWELPVLFLLEHNGYAQTTPAELTIAGNIEDRAHAFGIENDRLSDNDPAALARHIRQVVRRVRSDGKPFFQVIETRRLAAHSKGDDSRSEELLKALQADDVLTKLRGRLSRSAIAAVQQEIETEIEQALGEADKSPPAALNETDENGCLAPMTDGFEQVDSVDAGKKTTVGASLNAALQRLLTAQKKVFLLGEDLLDPYGGAFKVTRGLSSQYPDRVLATPISEAAIVGVAVGAALRGFMPIPEIMFGDFLTLATDQIVNHAAKFHWVYNEQVNVPITIRVPMGGRRGYGPTHSQSLEKMYLGVPGLRTVAVHSRHDAGRLLECAVVHDPNPVLFVEHKLLYTREIALEPPPGFELAEVENAAYPSLVWRPRGGMGADVTLVTYGYNALIAEEAFDKLFDEYELLPEYVLVTQLSPLRLDPIVRSVKRTRRLVTVEEASAPFGFGSEVVAGVTEAMGAHFRARRVGARHTPLPCARALEEKALPAADDVVLAVCEVIEE